jgi:hypothetical protein
VARTILQIQFSWLRHQSLQNYSIQEESLNERIFAKHFIPTRLINEYRNQNLQVQLITTGTLAFNCATIQSAIKHGDVSREKQWHYLDETCLEAASITASLNIIGVHKVESIAGHKK